MWGSHSFIEIVHPRLHLSDVTLRVTLNGPRSSLNAILNEKQFLNSYWRINTVPAQVTQSSSLASGAQILVKHPLRRVVILCPFLLVFLALYRLMALIPMPLSAPIGLFTTFMTICALYFFSSFVPSIC